MHDFVKRMVAQRQRIADHLKKQHPKSHRLRAILGLDAKNAAIVLPDADIELTVKECLLGTLSFNGQRCTALKMLIVHRSIAEAFLRRFTEELAKLKVGMPWEPGVAITPLPGLHRTAYMTEAIEDARAQGARVINEGGGAFCQTLFYPAVVYPVREGMKLYREEQFGPIIPVMPFDDLETALQYVITSDHGQQVSIFGSDPQQIGALVDPLVNQVCRVNLNCQCQRGPDVWRPAAAPSRKLAPSTAGCCRSARRQRAVRAAAYLGAHAQGPQRPAVRPGARRRLGCAVVRAASRGLPCCWRFIPAGRSAP
jgi:acyl-CoA reductase-like NAD-dependent aldehyde dehydrogenase